MKSQLSRLTRRSFVGMGAVLVLGLSVGTRGMPSAQAQDARAGGMPSAQAQDAKANARIIATFTVTLEPGVSHGFLLGPASVNRGYVVEVSPLEASSNGAHVQAFVQPEFDGSNWNDVMRVQLMAAVSVTVKANIRVYALVPKEKDTD